MKKETDCDGEIMYPAQLQKADETISGIESTRHRVWARYLLDCIHEAYKELPDTSKLPRLHVSIMSDCYAFEWIEEKARVGYTIELDVEESGWFFISGKDKGFHSESGHLHEINHKTLLERFISVL